MADKKQERPDKELDNLSFKDSWLQNTVQLAALGTIVAGAGTMAMHGNLGESLKGGKHVLRSAVNGMDRYILNKTKLPLKSAYRIGKQTFFNLRKMTPAQANRDLHELRSTINNAVDKVNNDPDIQDQIWKEVKKRIPLDLTNAQVDAVRSGEPVPEIRGNNTNRIKNVYEQVKGEYVNRLSNNQPIKGDSNQPSSPKQPLFKGGDMGKQFVTGGIYGLGLGAGITGFHYIDRLSKNPEAQKNLEDTYFHAGSFLNPREDEKKMDKKAGALEFYNALKESRKKLPEAVMAGIGYTGVSLGAAKLLGSDPRKTSIASGGNQPDLTGEPAANGPRVIIELGNQAAPGEDQQNMGTPPRLGGLPKFSSDEAGGLAKLAFPNVRQFWQDFKGHEAEIERLNNIHHPDVAAEALKNENIQELLKAQYGNLVQPNTEAQFTTRLFDSRAKQSEQATQEKIRELQSQTARAHLGAGGAALGTAGLAGLGYAYSRPNREDVQNV